MYDGKNVQLTGEYKLYGDDVYVEYTDGVYLSVAKPLQKSTKRANVATVKNEIKKDEL